jgi:hypothetical protein
MLNLPIELGRTAVSAQHNGKTFLKAFFYLVKRVARFGKISLFGEKIHQTNI